MKKLVVLAVLFSVAAAACSQIVPSYTTNSTALEQIRIGTPTNWEIWPLYEGDPGDQITAGHFAVLLPESFRVVFRGEYENYGQQCTQDPTGTSFDLDKKVMHLAYRVTTANPDFLTWCQNQMPPSFRLYIADTFKMASGYSLQENEEWFRVSVSFEQ